MMKRCKMEVVPGVGDYVVLWCNTCHENVTYGRPSLTTAQIRETARGHHRVMRRARELQAEFEKVLDRKR